MSTLAAVVITLAFAGAAFAQSAATPGIDKRQANQERKIQGGVASGQLTPREANRLQQEQKKINKMESRAKADGVVTARERTRLHRQLDKANRVIGKEKHDRQTDPGR